MPPEAVLVDADAMRLAQVFANLLNNASKYSPPGAQIRLSSRRQDADVIVCVADDGIGIAPEEVPTIFEMFSQASQALDRSEGGLGIGLSLVKGLVELHGGQVSVRSPGVDRGSVFEVRLPAASHDSVPSAGSPQPPRVHGTGRRVLIADDNRDGADTLALVTGKFGHDVRTVYDGIDAVSVAETFKPHIVLLDLGMPRLNGFETARRLRALPHGDAIILIAVTGWGQARDRQLTAEAGFDAHLVKPVDPIAMQELLTTLSSR